MKKSENIFWRFADENFSLIKEYKTREENDQTRSVIYI